MTDLKQIGQAHINELVKHIQSPEFNELERKFIRDVSQMKYDSLSKHQKAVVNRLVGWIKGSASAQ